MKASPILKSRKLNKSDFVAVGLIVYLSILFKSFIFASFYPVKPLNDKLFIPEIFNFSISIPSWSIFIFGTLNLILFWFLVRKIINKDAAHWGTLLYGISPWILYAEVFGSVYIILLFLLFCFAIGALNFSSKLQSRLTVIASGCLLLFSSLFMWVILPFFSFMLLKNNKIKSILVLFLFIILALIFLSKPEAIKNIYSKDFSFTKDISRINTVNELRGETLNTKFKNLAIFVENKYVYLGNYFLFTFLQHISPVTYFTGNKLLPTSFIPPIYIGFIIPLIFGLIDLIRLFKTKVNYLIVILFLIVPSLFAEKSPDFFRLVIFAPVIFLCMGLGLNNLILNYKKNFYKILIIFIGVLVFTEIATLVPDIAVREPIRIEEFRAF